MQLLSENQQIEIGNLYLSGISVQKVANQFGVGFKATLNALKRQNISRRTNAETNRLQFEATPVRYNIKNKLTQEEEDLKLAAVMLYWAEGYKISKNTVDFANSDPDMALLFTRFLFEICGIQKNRIRCSLFLYEGQDVEYLHEFWSKLLGIPRSQFTKPYIKEAAATGPRGPRMIHGLVHVRYCDTKLLRQILAWIDEYRLLSVGGGVVNRIGL